MYLYIYSCTDVHVHLNFFTFLLIRYAENIHKNKKFTFLLIRYAENIHKNKKLKKNS